MTPPPTISAGAPDSAGTPGNPAATTADLSNPTSPTSLTDPGSPRARRPGLAARFLGIGRPPRIMGLDIARGLAIIGMAAAHMASAPDLVWSEPATWGGIVHGRASVLFALLAGVSTALITGRTALPERSELPRLRLRLLGRGAAIFVIGLVLELLNTSIAVILCVYGVLFLLATMFLRWRVRRLVLAAAAFAIVGPFALAALNVLLFGPFGPGVSLAVFGIYPVPVWIAFLLAGMALGRFRLDRARVNAGILLAGIALAVIGYAAGAFASDRVAAWAEESPGSSSPVTSAPIYDEPSTFPGSLLSERFSAGGLTCDGVAGQWLNCYSPDSSVVPGEDAGPESYWSRLAAGDPWRTVLTAAVAVSPHSGGVFDIVGSGGFALAVVGLCLLAARPLRYLLLPIACLGMMPLSAYTAHVFAYWLIAGGPQGYLEGTTVMWAWNSAGLVGAALLWTVLFGRGPLERLVGRIARRAEGS